MIWFLRHGEAEDSAPSGGDDARRLTEKGERQSVQAGKALAALGVEFDVCLTSPKVRALDTAKLACKELDRGSGRLEPEVTDAIKQGPFDPLELIAGRPEEVLLVGHEPDFSNAIAQLTGATVKLKKGGVAACEPNLLHLLLRPAELKRIA